MRELLELDCILAKLKGEAKQQVLKDLSAKAGEVLGLDAVSIFDVLWEREKLGTTGVGGGIAIPHGRVAGVKKVSAFFARLDDPIAFDAVDDEPVDLVFLLLAPIEAGADHLHALACVSRLLRDPELCAALRKAKGQSDLYRLLTETKTAKAA